MSDPVAIAEAAPPASRWRASPRTYAQLLAGLTLFGAGEGLMVVAGLGVSPWTVLAQGVSVQTSLDVGQATILVSFLVLLCWIPLRQALGIGTLANAVVIGLSIDATIALLDRPDALVPRAAMVFAGIGIVAVGSALYLTCRLGPGPRDGLMSGLHRRTGRSVRLVRTSIEVMALTIGFLLGGTLGLGTVAFALLIGPAVQLALRGRAFH